MAYAFGCGRACISTPYHFARDLLADGRGILVPFRDSGAIADAVLRMLDNPDLKKKMERKSFEYSRRMMWPNVAGRYLEIFNQVLNGG